MCVGEEEEEEGGKEEIGGSCVQRRAIQVTER